jgi:hypothetical protein
VLDGGHVTMKGVMLSGAQTGLMLKDSDEISENIILDNEQNIFSDFPLKLDPNYIGQYRQHGMPRYAEFR